MKTRQFSLAIVLTVAFVMFICESSWAQGYEGKKILFINSYHKGYDWSDGIERGVISVLKDTGIELKIFRMDTKNNTSEEFIRAKGRQAKMLIERFKPDVVITSDDNAFKHVIRPYYRDAELPVVFCGLNWDASIYDAPYKNTTGMIEVALIPRLIEYLKQYASGDRIGHIAAEVLTARKEGTYYRKLFKLNIKERYVKTMAEWKDAFIAIQEETDILIVGNNAGILDWDIAEAKAFAEENTKIPSGTIYTWMMPYALLGLAKVEEEQGEWAARAALRILDGTPPSEIPLAKNKKGRVILNLTIAEKLGIIFSPALLKNAEILD